LKEVARNAFLWSAIGLLILLVAGTVLILAQPVLFTGRYYELTIRSVDHSPHGIVTITYDDAITYDTSVEVRYAIDAGYASMGDSWDSRRRSFLRWPRRERDKTLGLYLLTRDERAKDVGDSPAVRQRFLLKEGTYRVRPGERLVLFRGWDIDGTRLNSYIEIEQSP
jgi:hypothetical protein